MKKILALLLIFNLAIISHAFGINLNAGPWSATNAEMQNVDINGGTIDGTAIGGTTPAAGAFTTL
ncbi:hypothetical protein KAR91_77900, partial [Candidatus Pacearchaeota archaeon]|nr:hypothetical protein [Candidatus Pacearchaeota archaeon]